MTGLIIFVHALICLLLITIILIQPGKGGGLTESLASAESIFGAKTNVFIIKTTTVLAAFFLVTCLGLAILSSQKSRSLMSQRPLPPVSAPEEAPQSPSVDASVAEPESAPQAPAEPAPEPAPEKASPLTGPIPEPTTAPQTAAPAVAQ